MDKRTMPLIHYPTTTIFVDDNLVFLQSLSLLFGEGFAFQLFDSARQSLDFINASSASLSQRIVDSVDPINLADDGSTEDILFARKIIDKQKYKEISVVVVDYTMPEMNGLEFCSRLDNPLIKKILFTGQADETIASRAINQGVIDAYILKSASKVTKTIVDSVNQLKNDYFLTAAPDSVLSDNENLFCDKLVLQPLLNSLLESGRYVEYYYQPSPTGYLLFTRTGVCNRLVVYSQECLARFIAQHAKILPSRFKNAIVAGEVIPYLSPQQSLACGRDDFRWQDCLYPAKSFSGDIRYHYALIDNPQLQLPTNQSPSTYETYLREIDQQLL